MDFNNTPNDKNPFEKTPYDKKPYDGNPNNYNNNYPNNGYPNNGYPNNGYPNDFSTVTSDKNRTIKIVAVIASVTVVIAIGLISFLLIFLNNRGDKGNTSGTVRATQAVTTVDVNVEKTVEMPDLTGLSEEDAVNKLTDLGLKADIKEVETDEAKEGKVFKHLPSSGKEIDEGEEVTIYVAKAKPTQKPTAKATEKATAAPKPNTSSVTYLYCTAADYVSLRSGPGVSYTEYVRIPSRDGMIYLGEKSGIWYKVRYGDYTGYVSGNYVSFDKNAATNYTPDGGSSKTSRLAGGAKYLYCTASDFVSLRTGPGVSYTELARIPSGNTMIYMGEKSGNWYYVKYGSQYGYVSASWVAFK